MEVYTYPRLRPPLVRPMKTLVCWCGHTTSVYADDPVPRKWFWDEQRGGWVCSKGCMRIKR